jgi:hypothetical protein
VILILSSRSSDFCIKLMEAAKKLKSEAGAVTFVVVVRFETHEAW